MSHGYDKYGNSPPYKDPRSPEEYAAALEKETAAALARSGAIDAAQVASPEELKQLQATQEGAMTPERIQGLIVDSMPPEAVRAFMQRLGYTPDQIFQMLNDSSMNVAIIREMHRVARSDREREEQEQLKTAAQETMHGAMDAWAAKQDQKKNTSVDKPDHYNKGGIECFDAMDALTLSWAEDPALRRAAHMPAQVLKYIWRAPWKGAVIQDLEKALWHLVRMIRLIDPEWELDHRRDWGGLRRMKPAQPLEEKS